MLDPADFRESIQAIEALGATPAVLMKVVALAKHPMTDIGTICELLRNDGPLAADIIRIGNSPYYSPTMPCGNLTEAVKQIGMRELIWVVNLSLARQLFARDLPGHGVTAREYWGEAVASALVMQGLASELGMDREDAHMIGMLHGIGCILIERVMAEKGLVMVRDRAQAVAEWERGMVGFDFGEAGAMLLEHWGFPPATCEAIQWQTRRKGVAPASLAGALHFTGRLLALTGWEFEWEGWRLPEKEVFLVECGLTRATVARLVASCRQEFQGIAEVVDWKGRGKSVT